MLVATDLAARGLDSPHVSLVVTLEPPVHPHTYLHRVGRAGRFGNEGTSVSLASQGDDWLHMQAIATVLKLNINVLPEPSLDNVANANLQKLPHLSREQLDSWIEHTTHRLSYSIEGSASMNHCDPLEVWKIADNNDGRIKDHQNQAKDGINQQSSAAEKVFVFSDSSDGKEAPKHKTDSENCALDENCRNSDYHNSTQDEPATNENVLDVSTVKTSDTGGKSCDLVNSDALRKQRFAIEELLFPKLTMNNNQLLDSFSFSEIHDKVTDILKGSSESPSAEDISFGSSVKDLDNTGRTLMGEYFKLIRAEQRHQLHEIDRCWDSTNIDIDKALDNVIDNVKNQLNLNANVLDNSSEQNNISKVNIPLTGGSHVYNKNEKNPLDENSIKKNLPNIDDFQFHMKAIHEEKKITKQDLKSKKLKTRTGEESSEDSEERDEYGDIVVPGRTNTNLIGAAKPVDYHNYYPYRNGLSYRHDKAKPRTHQSNPGDDADYRCVPDGYYYDDRVYHCDDGQNYYQDSSYYDHFSGDEYYHYYGDEYYYPYGDEYYTNYAEHFNSRYHHPDPNDYSHEHSTGHRQDESYIQSESSLSNCNLYADTKAGPSCRAKILKNSATAESTKEPIALLETSDLGLNNKHFNCKKTLTVPVSKSKCTANSSHRHVLSDAFADNDKGRTDDKRATSIIKKIGKMIDSSSVSKSENASSSKSVQLTSQESDSDCTATTPSSIFSDYSQTEGRCNIAQGVDCHDPPVGDTASNSVPSSNEMKHSYSEDSSEVKETTVNDAINRDNVNRCPHKQGSRSHVVYRSDSATKINRHMSEYSCRNEYDLSTNNCETGTKHNIRKNKKYSFNNASHGTRSNRSNKFTDENAHYYPDQSYYANAVSQYDHDYFYNHGYYYNSDAEPNPYKIPCHHHRCCCCHHQHLGCSTRYDMYPAHHGDRYEMLDYHVRAMAHTSAALERHYRQLNKKTKTSNSKNHRSPLSK